MTAAIFKEIWTLFCKIDLESEWKREGWERSWERRQSPGRIETSEQQKPKWYKKYDSINLITANFFTAVE